MENSGVQKENKWGGIFSYSSNSPSGLIWEVDQYCGYQNRACIKRKGKVAGTLTKGYWQCVYLGNRVPAHRIIYEMFFGEIPCGMVIDHIDGNSLNNSPYNLRAVRQSINNRNRRVTSSNNLNTMGVFRKTLVNKSGSQYSYFGCTWTDLDGKKHFKYFSIDKLGEDGAFKEAVKTRENEIFKLNLSGAGYSENHGRLY